MLAERFANKCQKSEQFSQLFPKNDTKRSRNNEQYDVKFAKKGRLFDSAIPTMQRMLNKQKKKWRDKNDIYVILWYYGGHDQTTIFSSICTQWILVAASLYCMQSVPLLMNVLSLHS